MSKRTEDNAKKVISGTLSVVSSVFGVMASVGDAIDKGGAKR